MSAEAGPRHEVRKTVTVVFVDVTGSTSLGERLDPERVRRVMRSYFAAMREILERHGGTVEKFIGDAVMAVFGVPTVHEDDALRACRAAIDIRERLHHLNAELEREQGFTIEVRTGVNTGEVVVEEDASAEAMIVGDAVNVAARLEQEAAPGEILLGASTYRMVRDAVRAEPLEPITLKGKAEPVPAYRLLDLTPDAEPLPRRLVSPIVGRERELAIVRQAFERATAQGALQLLTVLGSAGVGKSRLIAEFLAGSEGERQVLRGRCLPYGEGVTYLPLAAAIKAAAQITDEVAPEEAAEKLAALVEGDADGDLICGLVQQMLGLAPATAPQEELFWGARRLVEILASRLPVILVLDDIHWAEPTLLDLIEHLADWSRDAAILLICSARPELLDERPTWGGGKLNAASMLLEPLGAAASEELVDNLVGSEALPPASRTAITAAAEGNPLFVEEMLGVLVDDGVLRRVDGRWEAGGDVTALHVPPTIHALLAARLDRLGRSEREVAQVASVVGRVFDRASVEAVVPEAARTAVRSTIMALVRKDLVRPDRAPSSGSEAFRFRHVLIRDAAYDGLPKEDRSRLHEAVADWLETTAGERKAEYLEIIGYHLEQAYGYRRELGVTGAADEQIAGRAADLLATAAQQAIARTDIPATISLLTRATSLLPPDDPRRLRLLPELADALGEVDASRATATFGEAIERAEAAGNELLRAHAVVLGRLNGLLVVELPGEELVNNNEREAERGIKAFAAVQDQVGLSRAWRLRGSVESQRGRLAKCQAAIEKALEYARAAGDAREQADCIFQLSFTLTQGPTPVEEGIRRCTEMLAEYPGDRAVEGWMVHALAHLRARRGEFAEAAALAARCRQILQDTGQEASYALLSEVVADVHMLAGNVDGAIDVLTDAARTYERMGAVYPVTAALLARALCAAGRYDEAEPMATQGMTIPGPAFKALAKAQLAKVRAYAGDVEDAERLVTEAAAWFEPTDWLIQRGDILMDVAEIHRVSGRPDDARRATEQALETYRQKGDLVSARRADAQLREAPPG